jgi:uncharacterized RDD family membrane protein YckC
VTCSKCQQNLAACVCQAELLPPPPEWRQELQHRVDAYRARRRSHLGAPVLEFPSEARPLRRPRTATLEGAEPLADPVSQAPVAAWARPQEPAAAPRVEWEPPPAAALTAAVRLPAPPPESELAEEVAAPRVAPRPAPAPARTGVAGRHDVLQLALPMAPREEAALPAPVAVAPRGVRLEAALVDVGVVGLAALAFALAAWGALGFPAPQAQMLRPLLPVIVLTPGALAAMYFLLCGYSGGGTLGMQACGLRVVKFDGGAVEERHLLQRRAWASLISLAALGLGYLWAYCDVQQLTWHDYITRTCIGERERASGERA